MEHSVVDSKQILIIMYSDEAAQHSFPEDAGLLARTREAVYNGQIETRICDAIEEIYNDTLYDFVSNGYPTVKVGVIDDEYYQWLGSLFDTSEMRMAYVNQLSEYDASRLMRRYGKDWQLNLYAIPITVRCNKGVPENQINFDLTPSQIRRLTSYFKKNFSGSEIYIPGHILPASSPQTIWDDLYDSCVRAICNNEPFNLEPTFDLMNNAKQINIARYYLPILIGYRQFSAVIKVDKLLEKYNKYSPSVRPELMIFDESHIKKSTDAHLCAEVSFEKGHIEQIIKKSFVENMQVDVIAKLILSDDVLDDTMDFYQKQMAANNNH